MITYLLQVSLCWIFFYSIYHLILRKETFFSTNRWYLLLSLWGSLLIPPLGQWVKQLFTTSPADMGQVLYLLSETPMYISQTLESRPQIDWLQIAIYTLYLSGVVVVGTRLLYGLYKIWHLYRNGRKVREQSYTLIYTNKEHLPFSFFNIVFFSEKVNLKPVFHQVIKHELSHVQQWHSLDVLLVELLQVFFWFNPILILYKKSLRESHEYFADACVLQGEDPKNYGRILLGQSASGLEIALANQFFNSQLKQRVRMMYQKKSNRSARLKYLMAVPLLFLALILFSNSMIVDQGPTPLKDDIVKIIYEGQTLEKVYKDVELLVKGYVAEHNLSNTELDELLSTVSKSTGFVIFRRGNELSYGYDTKIATEKGNLAVLHRLYGVNEIFTKLQREIAQFEGRFPLLNINGNLVYGYFSSIDAERITEHSYTDIKEAKLKYGDLASNGVLNLTISGLTKSELGNFGVILSASDKSMLPFNVIRKVDIPAQYPGCDDIEGEEAIRCAKEKFQEYIAETMQYPEEARSEKIEGEVMVKFIVTKEGNIANPQVILDIGGGCGKEALYLIQNMNNLAKNWTPAMHKGKKVESEVVVPIHFKLGGIASKKPFSARNDAFLRGETEQPVDNLVKEEGAAREMVSLLSEFEITPRPIFVVDGEITEKDDVNLYADEVASINILDEEMAAEKYQTVNQKAMEITTKSGAGVKNVAELLINEKNTRIPLDSHPLIILDGEEKGTDPTILENMDQESIARVDVLKPPFSVEKFGDKGENGAIIITTKEAENKLKVRVREGDLQVSGEEPLIVVDGKILGVGKEKISNLDPAGIQSMDVLKPPYSVEKFGDKGTNGAIIITTKDAAEKVKIRVNGTKLGSSDKEPLIILDGEILGVGKDKVSSLDPDQIASMEVLKPPHSVEKYGENAKHGVIIISSKDAEEIGEDGVQLSGQVKAFSDVRIYPNPAKGSFNLAFKGKEGPTVVEVYDIAGKSLYKQSFEDFQGVFQEEISSSNFVNTQAIIHIRQGDVIQHERITFTK